MIFYNFLLIIKLLIAVDKIIPKIVSVCVYVYAHVCML